VTIVLLSVFGALKESAPAFGGHHRRQKIALSIGYVASGRYAHTNRVYDQLGPCLKMFVSSLRASHPDVVPESNERVSFSKVSECRVCELRETIQLTSTTA
jgi:hypothetical protein